MSYISIEELKNSLNITSPDRDADLQRSVDAASNVVDALTLRTFATGPAHEVRYFTPVARDYLIVDNMIAIDSVEASVSSFVDWESVSTSYALTQGVDYYLDGGDTLRMIGTIDFQLGRARSVTVTGQWGFAQVPVEITAATEIIAVQLFKRLREAPFGILSTSFDGAAIRIGKFDPQVDALLLKWKRSNMVQ